MGSALSAQFQESPVGMRLIAALYVGASGGALAGLFPQTPRWLLCSLSTVVTRRLVWAVLLSAFYRPLHNARDVVMALTELYMAKSYLPCCERQLGSTRFLAWSLLSTVGVNAIFLSLMELLRRMGTCGTSLCTNQGLWPLVMVHMTTRALELPGVHMNVLGFVDVPSQWYPFSLAIGLSAVNGTFQWETVAAIAYGYAYSMLRLEDRLLLSRRHASMFERNVFPKVPGLLGMLLGGSWIPADNSRPQRHQDPSSGSHLTSGRDGNSTGDADAGFRLFGGMGHRLGD